ncbi:ABC transporter ATP-binding protein [Paenibacillus sp.]|uniref:ABC transporter ATP-binding protein n=1 Tax=Paenibacillus sp. TaxID=58172 RepID=UPI002D57346C|nr:ABC transporter ATP-binding protein [Paenibacillus sp.]HZG84210.1 ABC transporter ATP-binding protein [Paenibacillus sp.]
MDADIVLRGERIGKTVVARGRRLDILKQITLTLRRGEIALLKGRSGSGKTTLLNVLGGLDEPTEGRVWFGSAELYRLPEQRRTLLRRDQIHLVFQTYALLPQLTAQENVELALRLAGVPPKARAERAEDALRRAGLYARRGHRPAQLSGGERQRTALARSLAVRPAVLLADEPTSALDSAASRRVMEWMRSAAKEDGIAVCLTSHDAAIWEVADVVYELEDGRLV